jgi:hypothetical protein
MFYHKYNKNNGLIVSAFSDFKDKIDHKYHGMIKKCSSIMIPHQSIEKIFPNCVPYPYCYPTILVIPNEITLLTDVNGTNFRIYRHPMPIWLINGTRHWPQIDCVLKIKRSQMLTLMQIFALVKNKIIFHGISHTRICKISNCVHYQRRVKWERYVNNAGRNTHMINALLCPKVQKDVIFYYFMHRDKTYISDTDDILLTKSRLKDWMPDLKVIFL